MRAEYREQARNEMRQHCASTQKFFHREPQRTGERLTYENPVSFREPGDNKRNRLLHSRGLMTLATESKQEIARALLRADLARFDLYDEVAAYAFFRRPCARCQSSSD